MKKLLLFLVCSIVTLSIEAQNTNSIDTLFFEQGAEWKFLDNGSDQGTEWQKLNYDDSDWSTGFGQFGFDEGDEATLLKSGYITYYFRKVININNIADLEQIYFHLIHDDGAVLYINGTEAARSSLMPSGTIDYLTGTTTYIPGDMENEFWTYEVNKSLFIEGNNIIAIEVHNQSSSSSDISFDCYVSDNFKIEYKTDGPYVFYRNDSVIVKSIEKTGPKTATYKNIEEAELTCRFPNGVDSFKVKIQPSLDIEISEYELPEKFIAFSDIEGNIEGLTMLLKNAEVIDDNFNWTFGNGHLFFIGDMFDRGNNVTECLWLLYKLEQQAETANGKIHFILGNHDIMNMEFDFRYVANKYINNMPLIGETLESIYSTESELGRWLRTKNIIEHVGPFAFVHGGISPRVQGLKLTYKEMNDFGRDNLSNNCVSTPCKIINGGSDYGLYWYRGMPKQNLKQEQIDSILKDFNIEHVVIGHTVFDEITLLYNNAVIAIDLDHEENYLKGYMSALYYENSNLYEFTSTSNNQTYKLLCNITSLEEGKKSKNALNIKVFPNPAKEKLFIEAGTCNIQQIGVYDTTGRLLICKSKTSSSNYVDISNLQSGMYCVRVSTDNMVFTKKIKVE